MSDERLITRSILLDGRAVLAVDSHMDSTSFAQARMAQLLNELGYLVHNDGRIEEWRLEGTMETDGHVAFYGPAFPSRPLLECIENDEGSAALDALRRWAAARQSLLRHIKPAPAPIPAGALMDDSGVFLFLPERLVRRALDARGTSFVLENWRRWNHPDLFGEPAELYTLGTLAFRLFGGQVPFDQSDVEAVYTEMRYAPPPSVRFAAPNLAQEIANHIDSALRLSVNQLTPDARTTRRLAASAGLTARLAAPINQAARNADAAGDGDTVKKEQSDSARENEAKNASDAHAKRTPPLSDFSLFREELGPVGSGGPEIFRVELSAEDSVRLARERAKYKAKKQAVSAKRGFQRNSVIIAAVCAGLLLIGLGVRSAYIRNAEKPTTAGMSPMEVLETYYGAFNTLDYELMETCTEKPAGKDDIKATMNLHIVVKIRFAYETIDTHMSPDEWLEQGSPLGNTIVYGVNELRIETLDDDESDGRTSFTVEYLFWQPGNPEDQPYSSETSLEAGNIGPPAPVSTTRRDKVYITQKKGLWRVAQIDRELVE